MLLSLVVPTYNERENVSSVVERATAALKKYTESFEIIIVDDDSPDGTWKIAEELAQTNLHLRIVRRRAERGLASAVVAGWKVARGEIVGVMDGDLQHPPEALPALLDPIIRRRADITVGSRHVRGGGTDDWSFHRHCLSRAISYLAKLMLCRMLPPLMDPMSGFFLVRRRVIESAALEPRGYKILLEVLAKGTYDTLLEVPFVFRGRKRGTSKAGPKACLDSLVHFGRLLSAAHARRATHVATTPVSHRLSATRFPPFDRLDILALLVVLLMGVVNLPQPFSADQAQFTFTAENMRDGAVLYRDAWDLKQPGIFYFYLAGGSLFGFNELGIHLFELVCMTLFSGFLLFALKDRFKNREVACLTPILTVGIYYGVSGEWHQTQPESLMGIPAFLSLWFAYKSLEPSRRRSLRLFLSGVMGGFVLVFKFMFLPIPLAFWLTVVWSLFKTKEKSSLVTIRETIVPIALGVMMPLLSMVLQLFHQGALNIALWTFFEYPPNAVDDWPFGINIPILLGAVTWFVRNFAPLLALSVIGLYPSFRKDYLRLNLILWVVVGVMVILLQRLSWFQYHFMLLFVPLGLLAVWGLDMLWTALKRAEEPINIRVNTRAIRLIAVFSMILLFAPIWTPLAIKGFSLARNGFLLEDDRLRYQSKANADYGKVIDETAFLRDPESLSGTIYVFGDALYYYLSRREPAIPILVRKFLPVFMWPEVVKSLYDAPRPPYIFIAKDYLRELHEHTPEAGAYIDEAARFVYRNYDVLRSSDVGTWYMARQNSYAWRREN
jgi:glycosyltransferase involved in cell wall biosynthesis